MASDNVTGKKNEIFISLPGLDCKITSNNDFLISYLDNRFSDFIADSIGEHFTIDVSFAGKKFLEPSKFKHTPLYLKQDNYLVTAKNFALNGSFDLTKRQGALKLEYFNHLGPLKYFFWACYSLAALKKNIITLHCSSIDNHGKAILFSGQSGSGKSTIAKLSGRPIINDEVTIIYPKENKLWVTGNPLFGKSKNFTADSFELEKIYFIKKSKETFVREMTKSEQLSKLLSNQLLTLSIIFKESPAILSSIFKATAKLNKSIKASEMNFEKNDNFVKFL